MGGSIRAVKRRFAKEEFARRGDEIYERVVKPQLEVRDKGKFVAIDIETEEFTVDEDEMEACDRLRVRLPESQTWMVRVGSRFVHRFGGASLRKK